MIFTGTISLHLRATYTTRFIEQRSATDLSPLYSTFAKKGVRVLLFSGDADACVPYVGTAKWVAELAAKERWQADGGAWQPWLAGKQIAGYLTKYTTGAEGAGDGGGGGGDGSGADFYMCTVRGAGHMVPTDRPKEALAMLNNFLNAPLRGNTCEMWTCAFTDQHRESRYTTALSGRSQRCSGATSPESGACFTINSGEKLTVAVSDDAAAGLKGGPDLIGKPEFLWFRNGEMLPDAVGAAELTLVQGGRYQVSLSFRDGYIAELPMLTIVVDGGGSGSGGGEMYPAWTLAPTVLFSAMLGALLMKALAGRGESGAGGNVNCIRGGPAPSNDGDDEDDDVPMVTMN